MKTPTELDRIADRVLGQASEGTAVESNNGRINFTPKPITVDFDAPLRKHLDKAAINRGWEIYKKDASE